MQTQVSQAVGGGIYLHDGGKEVFIKNSVLEHARSQVTTHEGEQLQGRAAQRYMDRYSKQYLGKDLSGSYKSEKVMGDVH